jgi:hypothetical protein
LIDWGLEPQAEAGVLDNQLQCKRFPHFRVAFGSESHIYAVVKAKPWNWETGNVIIWYSGIPEGIIRYSGIPEGKIRYSDVPGL